MKSIDSMKYYWWMKWLGKEMDKEKVVYIMKEKAVYIMKIYIKWNSVSLKKQKEILVFVITWLNLEGWLSEISQT